MLRLQHGTNGSDRLRWSNEVWEQFRAESADRSARGTVAVTVLCSMLLLAWSVGDFQYFPEHALRFLYFRIGAVLWCSLLAVAAMLLRTPSAKFFTIWLWFLGWGAESAAMIPYTPEDLLSHTFVLIIAQLGSLGFVVWSWGWAFTMCTALLVIGEIALAQIGSYGYDTFAAHAYLVTGLALTVLFTSVKYRGAREQFDQRLRLREQTQRSERLLEQVIEMRQERLSWLENLAHFLRHELKNQAVAIGTSLSLTRETRLDRRAEQYVDRASRSLGRMKRLVDSATEATSLEAALAMEETRAVDLTSLVRERAVVFREVYPERRLLPVIEANVLVEGNEDRLVQLLDKLLENAVQHTYPGGEIRIKLTREHDCALFVVENNGDALPPNRDALFDAFVTVGAAGEEGQNLGLGLFVAKAIAEAHGGTITARDPERGRGARFEVRLNTC